MAKGIDNETLRRVSLEFAESLVNADIRPEPRRVLTYGTFDLLHVGHIRLLRLAAALGNYLIVALSTDEFNASKGKVSFYPYEVRREMLEALRFMRPASRYDGQGTERIEALAYRRTKSFYVDDLGSLPRRRFAGITLRTPENPDRWAREPISKTTPELARLQNDAKAIVAEIDRVCGIIGAQYFACGGTMLGYVRHGGFIPWDDDIDIGMLRADYERFLAEAPKHLDVSRYFLQTRKSDPNIPYLFSKVRLVGSEYLTEHNRDRDFNKGICVDVFPFDYVPDSLPELRRFKAEVRSVEKRHNYIVNRQYPESAARGKEPRHNLDWAIAQLNGRLLAHHYWGKSLAETQVVYEKTATRYNAQAAKLGLQCVASFVTTYTMGKVEDLMPVQRVPFEGIEINLLRNPEAFLQLQYGNFMEMPYPHQRTGHDLLLWSDAEGIGGGRLAKRREEASARLRQVNQSNE